jgi:hypothetical protein
MHSTSRGGQEFLLQYWAHRVWKEVWARLDANKDGSVDAQEFKQLDKDGDGNVSAPEMMAFLRDKVGYEVSPGEATFVTYVLRAGGSTIGGGDDSVLTWKEFERASEAVREEHGPTTWRSSADAAVPGI